MNSFSNPIKILKIILSPLLLLLGAVYSVIMLFRNLLYDLRILKVNFVSGPQIISIGNLTAGGTGKTPITAELYKGLMAKGLLTYIISRGYRGNYATYFSKDAVEVDFKLDQASSIFGDEPTWFNETLKARVWVGKNKFETAQMMLRSQAEAPQIILADDAFQHRKLGRNLDILVIDATAGFLDYLPLPLGRGREDFVLGLRRADIIILNKINLVSVARVTCLRNILKALKTHKSTFIEASNEISKFVLLDSNQVFHFENRDRKKVFLASGIARPAQFLDLINAKGTVQVAGHFVLPDHADFSSEILKRIESQALQSGSEYIVVTEKDAVKMKGVKLQLPILVSHLKLLAPELLDAVFDRIPR